MKLYPIEALEPLSGKENLMDLYEIRQPSRRLLETVSSSEPEPETPELDPLDFQLLRTNLNDFASIEMLQAA